MKEVIIEVPRIGDVKITTKGFKGSECKDATDSLVKALGGEVVSDTPTKEMNETNEDTNTRGTVKG
jgi:hypothetical protein